MYVEEHFGSIQIELSWSEPELVSWSHSTRPECSVPARSELKKKANCIYESEFSVNWENEAVKPDFTIIMQKSTIC